MFEVNFFNCFLNLRKDLASEELAQRSEDLLRCLWLRTDALLLLSACDVIFVKVWWPTSLVFEPVWWPTSSTAHNSSRSRYLATHSYHYKTLLQFGGKQRKRHNFIFIFILNLKSRFIFCIGCLTLIVYHKYLFQVFFKLENVTCDRCPHPITNSYNVNEEM